MIREVTEVTLSDSAAASVFYNALETRADALGLSIVSGEH